MSNYAISLKRSSALLAAVAFSAVLLAANFATIFGAKADAAQLTNRKVTLSSTRSGTIAVGSAGTETNGAAAVHTFDFTVPSGNVGSVLFKYCTNAIGACTRPTNMSMASVTLGGTTGFPGVMSLDNTGLEVVDSDCTGSDGLNNCIGVVSSAPGAATTVSAAFNLVRNPDYDDTPTDPDENTFFVRIIVSSDAAFATDVHDGTVASAITEGIVITARVAETLGFSTTGATLVGSSGVGDPGATCAALTGSGAITLGDPQDNTLSITSAYDNYSAFRLYTNAANGVVVQYEGDTLRRTLTSAIAALVTKGDSEVGEEQFGLGVDTANGGNGSAANTVNITSSNTDVDAEYFNDATALADAGNGPLTIAANYADGYAGTGSITDGGDAEFHFAVDAPTNIASATSFTNCKTVAVRYLANISPLTPAGTYTTTIVYSAVPTY